MASLLVNGLLSYPGIYPNVYIASLVIPVIYAAAMVKYNSSVTRSLKYNKTCLKRNLKGPEHFSAKASFPFNQGTHIKINPGHARI
jgi:hypothetical protein